jgi:cytochrome b561
MQFKNTPERYGAISKSFHWLMAFTIIFMLCLGFYMGGAEELTDKIKLYGLHKSIGVAILILVTLRVLWHLYSKRPPLVDGMKPREKLAAHAGHIFLYLAMFGMPMSGWLLSSAAGRSVSFFGLFTLPDLIAPDDALRDIFGAMHYFLAFGLIAMIIGHVGAALKHHFISKDATLKRMLP